MEHILDSYKKPVQEQENGVNFISVIWKKHKNGLINHKYVNPSLINSYSIGSSRKLILKPYFINVQNINSNSKLFKAGTIYSDYNGKIDTKKIKPLYKNICLNFPTRLAPMSIDDTIFSTNSKRIYSAGGIVVSIDNPIKIILELLNDKNGILHLDKNTRNPAIINHGYRIMCKLLNVSPSLSIYIDDSKVPRHSGFASNGASLGAVCSSINELFGTPIRNKDLLRFLATNYGEQYNVGDSEFLYKNICVGGCLATGLYKDGIQVLTGHTLAGSTKYYGTAIIAIPFDYKPISSNAFLNLEQIAVKNLIDFPNEDYKRYITSNFKHIALPKLASSDISGISNIIFGDRFNDEGGLSIKKFVSKIFPRSTQIAEKVRSLYDNDKPHCDMLGTSSLSPTFFALTSNKVDENICIKRFKEQNMAVYVCPICNDTYSVEFNKKNL